MKDILSEIIAHKQTEIELQKQTVSPEQLQEQAGVIIRENAAHRRSMKQALAASSTGIISVLGFLFIEKCPFLSPAG